MIRFLNFLIDKLEKLKDKLKCTPKGITAKEWSKNKKWRDRTYK